jgi:hypothetical protein
MPGGVLRTLFQMIVEASTNNSSSTADRQSAFFLGGANEDDVSNMRLILSSNREGITNQLVRRATEITIKDLPPSRKLSTLNGIIPRKVSVATSTEPSNYACVRGSNLPKSTLETQENGISKI